MFLYEHEEVDNAVHNRAGRGRNSGRRYRLYRQMLRVDLRRGFQPLVGGSSRSFSRHNNCSSFNVPVIKRLINMKLDGTIVIG